MSRVRFILAAGLVALVAAAGSSAATPTLVGKVAPGGDRLVELAQPTQGPRTLGQQALTFQS